MGKLLGLYGLFAVLLLVAGCTSAPTATPTPTVPPSLSFDVQIDGNADDINVAFLAYFPNELTARPGDTIRFKLVDTGEPHSVTLGTLVDDLMSFSATLCQPGPGVECPALTEEEQQKQRAFFVMLPPFLPEGPGDAIQAGAQPCYLATGAPPTPDACAPADQEQPEFNGRQTFYNSGWLKADQVFTVQLADDIGPGEYSYFCILHRELMSGKIKVAAKGTTVPSPAEVTAQAQQEIAGLVEKLKAAKGESGRVAAAGGPAWAGAGSTELPFALVNEFIPQTKTIKAGEFVWWLVLGPHTISFNAPQGAKGIRIDAPDGSIHLNPMAMGPTNSPGQMPPDPATPVSVIDAGAWDGNGFLNSGLVVGLMMSFPPALTGYQLTFTTPGTYTYLCLIHDKMEGTINVTA
ncbi:MAG: hypothetical protein HY532_00010 [Chloroflexi bacterium]|nr:hypothetical protein [Chloroflexota bacterium]